MIEKKSDFGNFEGTGTEIITVFLPFGQPKDELERHLRSELNLILNVKDLKMQDFIHASLTGLLENLNAHPLNLNGSIFVASPVQVRYIYPSKKIKDFLYWCDSKPCKELMDEYTNQTKIIFSPAELAEAKRIHTRTAVRGGSEPGSELAVKESFSSTELKRLLIDFASFCHDGIGRDNSCGNLRCSDCVKQFLKQRGVGK